MEDPERRPGPAPRQAVRLELLRVLGDVLLGPFRFARYLLRRRKLESDLRGYLLDAAPPDPPPQATVDTTRPLRIFLSCAEPSGEIHARSLVAALRERAREAGWPEPEFVGLGGARIAELGVRVIGDPVARAAMGFGVVRALPFYLDLLTRAATSLREDRVDVVAAVDSPALHVPLGHLAHRYGVPVVHFVTPQYWGWMPWRVRGYRQAVDRALSILPFEPAWFRAHGVATAHVGHPIADALEGVPTRAPDLIVEDGYMVLLPGSRESVMRRNLPWMLEVLASLQATHPDLRAVLPHDRDELESTARELVREAGMEDRIELRFGDLHEHLAGARAAFSVSGTVLLDLLHHRLPTVVVYRLGSRLEATLGPHLLTVPYFASINLLTGRETCPEFHFFDAPPTRDVLEALGRIWADPEVRARMAEELELAASRLGGPGAADRAAAWVLEAAGTPR